MNKSTSPMSNQDSFIEFKKIIDSSIKKIKSHYIDNYQFYQSNHFKDSITAIGNAWVTFSDESLLNNGLQYFKEQLRKEIPQFLTADQKDLSAVVKENIAYAFIEVSEITAYHRDIIIDNFKTITPTSENNHQKRILRVREQASQNESSSQKNDLK